MTRPALWIAALAAAAISAACTPTLDWREFVPEGSEISVRFPCRPDRSARPVTIAGATVQMQMLVCSAGDATFALAFVELADPARIGITLAAGGSKEDAKIILPNAPQGRFEFLRD